MVLLCPGLFFFWRDKDSRWDWEARGRELGAPQYRLGRSWSGSGLWLWEGQVAWLAAQAACLAPVLVCGYFLLKDVVVVGGLGGGQTDFCCPSWFLWPTVEDRMGEEGVGQGSSVPMCVSGGGVSRLP